MKSTVLIFVLIQLICNSALSQDSDLKDTCLVNYYFQIHDDYQIVDTFNCNIIHDELYAGALIHNSNEDRFFEENTHLHFRFLEMYNLSSRRFPKRIQSFKHLEELWFDYPKCNKMDEDYLVELNSLKNLRITANLKKVPQCFYELENLDDIGIFLNRNVQLDTTKLLQSNISSFSTNLKINLNNAIGIAQMNPKELYLIGQRNISESYLLFIDIPIIRVYGTLNEDEQLKLLKYLPHAQYNEP
ncbi:MAG: hypothetical protein QNK23_08575 [Crocinitomicaceae bacterium]|nr:hypothetical protein [Crocinitomicaceae bacterium]